MKKLLFSVVLIFVLAISTFAMVFLNRADQPVTAESANYDVNVLVHLNDLIEPAAIRSMLKQTPFVTGLQFDVWVGDNSTGGITDAKARIAKWLNEFADYRIIIQCDYAFDQKYGYYDLPFWKYNNTETLSQEWYNEWYGNLSEVLNQHPNVQLMVGFNEPYNHFQTKELAQTIMEREYLTWKNFSSIPFSVKFSMPYIMWAIHWGFPENASIENDCVPIWKNYSDYIGMDLWADGSPPQYGYGKESVALDWVKQTISMAENYSKELNKPIFIGEFPAWYPQTLKYICDHVMQEPNIGIVYQLWYWSGQEELHYDAWTYALFNVDPTTLNVTRADLEWNVFNQILNPAFNQIQPKQPL